MNDVTGQVAAIRDMTKNDLTIRWAEYFHQPAPPRMRQDLMASILAYRLQERHFGGLSHGARQKMRQIASSIETEHRLPKASRKLKAGTRLLRSWGGELHEVNMVEGEFFYRDARYGSLSEIARKITGTRWSGPLFFGTRKVKA